MNLADEIRSIKFAFDSNDNRRNLLENIAIRVEDLQRPEVVPLDAIVSGTDFMPAEEDKHPIYSKRIIFTANGTEYKGWVRFDFQEFISEKKHSFEYKKIENWHYDPEYH